jgi:hypothetical protein
LRGSSRFQEKRATLEGRRGFHLGFSFICAEDVSRRAEKTARARVGNGARKLDRSSFLHFLPLVKGR